MLIAVAYLAALGIRSLDGRSPRRLVARVLGRCRSIIAVHLVANVATGAYGHVWEYASIGEARRVLAASFWASAIADPRHPRPGDFGR